MVKKSFIINHDEIYQIFKILKNIKILASFFGRKLLEASCKIMKIKLNYLGFFCQKDET